MPDLMAGSDVTQWPINTFFQQKHVFDAFLTEFCQGRPQQTDYPNKQTTRTDRFYPDKQILPRQTDSTPTDRPLTDRLPRQTDSTPTD